MKERIKILVLAANPADTSPMRLGAEVREIGKMLRISRYPDAFDLQSEWAVRPEDLQEALLNHEPHIVHFASHSNRRGILLEGDDGNTKLIKKELLAEMFRLLRDNIRIVVLNSCYSRLQIEALTTTIDFTIGMNKPIGESAARVFASTFYGRLAFGRSIQNAFELAKNQVHMKGLRYHGEPELLAKEGCDPSQVYLVNKPYTRKSRKQTKASHFKPAELRTILEKTLSGDSSLEDRQKLRQAVTSGHLVFTNEDSASTSKSDNRQPLIKCYSNQMNVEILPAAYGRLQKELFPEPHGVAPPFPSLIFVGREGALADIKGMVGISKVDAASSTITIVRGWPGVGKTSLASVIGRDADTSAAFPGGVLWTALGQQPNLLAELAKWGRALGTEDLLRLPLLDDVAAHLQRRLQGKRMLLIVDDVWDAEHAKPFIQICGETNALLMTTRETSNVARAFDVYRPAVYLLPELKEEDAFKLLSVLAPAVVEAYTERCRDLVRTLECLPLSIHVAGSLLKTEAQMGWGVEELIKEIEKGTAILQAKTPADRREASVSVLLAKSTDLLSDRARECFAFLGAFASKPATFDLQAMRAVWQMKDPKPIVQELVGHGLLEPVGAGRFQMHALLVAHAESLCTV